MVHLCSQHKAEGDIDISLGGSNQSQSPILNSDGESSVSTISQVTPRTHQMIKIGYYGPLRGSFLKAKTERQTMLKTTIRY